MASGMKKTGNWLKVNRIVVNLANDINSGTRKALTDTGLKAEKIAVKHIKNQDLEWEALDKDYKKRKDNKATENLKPSKKNKEVSTKTLIATSDYFNSITSYRDGDTAFAGVKKDVENKDGTKITDIAAVHEFGTDNIPKRELWKPTFEETLKWMIDTKVFREAVSLKLRNRAK